MPVEGIKNPNTNLATFGIQNSKTQFWNLSSKILSEISIEKGMAVETDSGAIAVNTGKFTGRSPKDRYVVSDKTTEESVDWNNINQPISTEQFNSLYDQITNYLNDKDIYIQDAKACADPNYELKVRVIAEYPWSAQFASNMFLRLSAEELKSFEPDWVVINAPGFHADPEKIGIRQGNFAVINFTDKKIIIGGTAYTGEIKKGIFSVLNYILPMEKHVLSMHCSCNEGTDGNTAIFFGLSGTGKTTLSADPNRMLIGDDEHGWSNEGVFNFEGGCYAKTINLSKENEPDIYNAIRPGAILENIGFIAGTNIPDYTIDYITENTRVSYPIDHISNAKAQSVGGHPKNIFFLTCDAFGVLPAISKLTKAQAMYHFISGYTAKVAGTEDGIDEPQATFSACFGSPFLPLHPTQYAEMLGEKMDEHDVNIWLVNTGWQGGSYGESSRISLKYTRAMISAALDGVLENIETVKEEIFGLQIPVSCPGVPDHLLNPRDNWADKAAYDLKAEHLVRLFNKNFEKFSDHANETIRSAAPKMLKKI